MSKIKTLAGGYKDNSPRVRSENSQIKPVKTISPKIDVNGLIKNIKLWYQNEQLDEEDLKQVINQLQDFLNIEMSSWENINKDLHSQNVELLKKKSSLQQELKNISENIEIVNTIKALEKFFGKKTIDKVVKMYNNEG